jgi:outer membrane protein
LSLREALLLANENNENLALAGEDYLQALIDKDRAAAAFLPTISLAPTYFRQDKASSDVGDDDSRTDRFDVPVRGQMNLFNGFRDVANLRQAGKTIDQRRHLLWDLQQSLLLSVAETYYAVLRAERNLQVLRNSIAVQEERLRDIRGRQQAGMARPLDVAQIEAQESATRVALLTAQRNAQNGRVTLAFLIGEPVESSPLLDEYPLDQSAEPLDALLESALRERHDLLAAAALSAAARQGVENAVGQYYPSVSLDVAYFLSRQSQPQDSDWNALLSANLPILSAGLIHADVRTAWSRYRQARLDESLIARRIEQDVRTAFENLASSDAQIAELRVQLRAAEDAFRQAEESYRVGLATNLDRIQSQDRLLAAQLQLASEEFNRKISYLALLRAAGRSFVKTGVPQ